MSDVLKLTTHLDLAKLEFRNAVLQPLASAPSSPVEGQLYYNTADDTPYIYANGAWLDLGVQGGAGATDITITRNGTTVTVNSSTGTDGTIPTADGTNAGVLTASDYTRLANTSGTNTGDQTLIDLGVTATASELNALDGITSTTAELNYTDGVTSPIQTQLNAKAPLANPTFTGTVTVPTPSNGTDAANKTYVDNAVTGLLDYKGATDASTNPNYPAASKGDAYVVSVAGKVGGSSGTVVEVGDVYFATADNAGGTQASVGTSWAILEHNLQGALLSANNLSDVASAASAFGNIKQAATTSATGVVELATQAEAQAKSDTVRAVTPASLADFSRKVTGTVGDGATTSFPITHGLGSQYVDAALYEVSTGDKVGSAPTITSSTVITFDFPTAPSTNQYRYVIQG